MDYFVLLLLFVQASAQRSNSEERQQTINVSLAFRNNESVCPLLYYFDSNTRECQCFPQAQWLFTCDGIGNAFIEAGHIVTYNDEKDMLSLYTTKFYQSLKRYNITESGKVQLPGNISMLNDYICSPLNRKGYMCRDCIEEYGPTMIVSMCNDNVCYKCSESWHSIVIFLALEFLPITLCYLIILMFHIRMTAPPMTCYIVYSQLIIYGLNRSCVEQLLSKVEFIEEKGRIRPVTKIFLTLYGIFNLDFLRYAIPPFCISSKLKPIHIALMGYFSAFYPFLLITITWLFIKLHDRNFRAVVIIWKPFHKCFVKIRNGWSAKRDLADVFATFFLLCYDKIMYQTLLLLNTFQVRNYPSSSISRSNVRIDYVLSTDASIMLGSSKYAIVTTATILVFCVFNVFPALLITLYPSKKFRKAFLCMCTPRMSIAINTFVEKYHFCYRDGLDGGKDMRSFAGLYFFLRIAEVLLVIALSNAFKLEPWLLKGTIFSITALLIAFCKPYKKTYANVSDTLLLLYLATICHLLSANVEFRPLVPSLQAIFIFPFVALIFAICICKIQSSRLAKDRRCFKCLKAFVWYFVSLKVFGSTDAKNSRVDQEQLIQHPVKTYGIINY